MTGYRVGPTLPPNEAPWPPDWERTPDSDHLCEWETVLLAPSRTRRCEEVVRCATCHAPRCGGTYDDNPCMRRRHHQGGHATYRQEARQ